MFSIITTSVRMLVGCQALSNTVIAEIFTVAGTSELPPGANRALAHVGETVISFLIASIGAKKNVSQDIVASLTAQAKDVTYQAFVARQSGIGALLEQVFPSGEFTIVQLSLALNSLVGAVWQATQNLEDVARAIMLLGIVDANRDGLDLMAGFEEQLCARSCLSIPLDIETREFDAAAEGNEIYDTSSFHHRVMEPTHDGGMSFQASCLSFGNPRGMSLPSTTIVEYDQLVDLGTFPEVAQLETLSVGFPAFACELSMGRGFTTLEDFSPPGVSARPPAKPQVTVASPKAKITNAQTGENGWKLSILHETKKCRQSGLLPPQDTFFRKEIELRLQALVNSSKPSINGLFTILVQVASASSIVSLQEALRSSRVIAEKSQSERYARDLSGSIRLQVIEDLQGTIRHSNILELHHTVCLYRSCGGSVQSPHTDIIVVNRDQLGSQPKKKGNPVKNKEAEITDSMMERIFPCPRDLEQNAHKRRKVSDLRRLGQRLQLLIDQFGYGIIGLLSHCSSCDGPGPKISMNMILAPSIEIFREFINILEASQGQNLRRMSDVVIPIIHHLVFEDKRQAVPFPIEDVDTDSILQEPKWSEKLFSIFS
ncbi:unnamed protein product [Penicillium nalgiovense]|nr:unnamed protein product [Penicillium nalgiovense]